MTNREFWPRGLARDRQGIPKVFLPSACSGRSPIPKSANHRGRGDRVVAGFLEGVARRPTHGRRVSQAVIDSAAWAVALVLCSVLRLGTAGFAWWRLVPLIPLVV